MRAIALPLLLAMAISSGSILAMDTLKSTSLVIGDEAAPLKLGPKDSIATVTSFRPPVQITIVAKTDSTNLRMGYAADQVIFNWEMNPKQLRVDGGPANGKHKTDAGSIPTDKYVTVKWVVTPQKQLIYVDDQLRFEHTGDYSTINKPVRVFTHQANLSLKTLEVKPLPEAAGAK